MAIRTYISILIAITLLGVADLPAADAPVDHGRGDRTALYQSFEGMIIDSIVLDTRNIYDVADPKYDNLLFRTANKLHIVSNPHIIRRELLFKVGEPFSADAANETARNLRTRLAVKTAWIEPVKLSDGHVLVRVVTIDQWSLIATAKVSREGNETNYRFGIEERNFLGNHQYWNFDYYVQANEGDFHAASFRESRLFGKPIQISVADQNDPLNSLRQLDLSHPYYNQLQKFTLGGMTATTHNRTDVYRSGSRVAQWNEHGDLASVNGEYRWGPRFRKFGLGFSYLYRHTGITDRRVAVGVDPSTIKFPVDSTYHLLGPSVSLSRIRYVLLPHIQRMVYPEDATLGASVTVSASRSFNPQFSGYLYDVASINGAYLNEFNFNIIGLNYESTWQFREGDYSRRFAAFAVKYYNNYLSWFTLASQAKYFREWRADGLADLHLGGRTGIRGYDPFFRTGSAMMTLNVEGRFFSNIEILSTVLGAVVFTDLGTVWQENQRAFSQPVYRSIGVGLRISMEKFTKEETFRIDLSYGQNNNWEISFSNRQYFSL